MTMTSRGPVSPVETFSRKYVLSIKPTPPRPPRDGLERLERVLARPVWTRADRDRMKRASNGLWEHTADQCTGPDCLKCDLAARIDREVKEWDRIHKAPPIPSTAQLWKWWARPGREDRAVALAIKLSDRLDARKRTILDGLKKYKTAAVRYKHEQAAEDNDPGLKRINRAINRLRAIVPDVGRLAYARKYYK